ncbi:hypothetical protein B1R27_07485 [Streptomyces sp. GKU 895]|nr:hypothetical protein B1R27_07485 [Streptomyces sp. GKU 895]
MLLPIFTGHSGCASAGEARRSWLVVLNRLSRRLPIDRAEERLHHELGRGQQPLAALDLYDVWLRFVRFGSQRFDTPDTPDADGLLFQYGTHALEGPPI